MCVSGYPNFFKHFRGFPYSAILFPIFPTCMLGPSIHGLVTDKQVELYWKYFVEAELFKNDI